MHMSKKTSTTGVATARPLLRKERAGTEQAIPYLDLAAQMRPIRKDIDAAIAKTLDNCTFCLGPDVAQFEKEFAHYCGAKHAVAFNSGTSALHVALRLLNI